MQEQTRMKSTVVIAAAIIYDMLVTIVSRCLADYDYIFDDKERREKARGDSRHLHRGWLAERLAVALSPPGFTSLRHSVHQWIDSTTCGHPSGAGPGHKPSVSSPHRCGIRKRELGANDLGSCRPTVRW